MKKIALTFLLLAVAALVLSGQPTAQGNFLAGSQFGLTTARSNINSTTAGGNVSEESPTSTLFGVFPGVGYFLVRDMAIGIRMDYTLNQVKEPGESRVEDSDLLFGPFGRFYYPVARDMAFFAEGGFGFGNSSDVQHIGDVQQEINTNIFAAGIGPGLTVFSDAGIGIEAMVKYKYARSDFDIQIGEVTQNVVTKTNKFEISVGMQLYFAGIKPVRSTGYERSEKN